MQSKANSVELYLNELHEDRKESLSIVREAIVKNLPTGYVEVMNWGMITYEVPLETFPDTYNGKPLMYVALASQKNHMSVYLMGCYMSPEIRKKFENAYKLVLEREKNYKRYFQRALIEYGMKLDYKQYLFKVRDQGKLGTCAAMTASCIKEFQEIKDINLKHNLSQRLTVMEYCLLIFHSKLLLFQ